MTKTPNREPRPLFTPSTLPKIGEPDPVVAFIEDAMREIANRPDRTPVPEPTAA